MVAVQSTKMHKLTYPIKCIHVLPEDKGLADEESRRAAFARGEGQSPWTIEAINDRKVESDALNLQTLSLTSFVGNPQVAYER